MAPAQPGWRGATPRRTGRYPCGSAPMIINRCLLRGSGSTHPLTLADGWTGCGILTWMIRSGRVLVAPHPTERIEILSTPAETPDRYRLRLTAPPRGGPGITGLGPHRHSGLVEEFCLVSGAMTVRIGREIKNVVPGDEVAAPAGTIHGFRGTGDDPLVVDVDLVFTAPGPRPSADLVQFWAIVDRLIRERKTDPRTGMP